MTPKAIVSARAKWIELVEAVHAPAADDLAWSEPVLDTARTIFPSASVVGIYSLEYTSDLSSVRTTLAAPRAVSEAMSGMMAISKVARHRTWVPYHFGAAVLTYAEATRELDLELADAVEASRRASGFSDALGIIAHPAPGLVTALVAGFEHPVTLGAYERRLLARLALHLETEQRARRRPESVTAEVTADGRILRREGGAPADHVVKAAVARVEEARARRASGEGLELWTALVSGRVSLAPRTIGNEQRYLVLDNPPARRALRELSPSETAVLSLASRGLPTKLVAYGLGIPSSSVSERLSSAAAKIGSVSRAELVRIAALLAGDPRSELGVDALTEAERDVLALLQRGLSNPAIARLRSRSVRTIANQVASLLKKTGSASRRALVVSAPRVCASSSAETAAGSLTVRPKP